MRNEGIPEAWEGKEVPNAIQSEVSKYFGHHNSVYSGSRLYYNISSRFTVVSIILISKFFISYLIFNEKAVQLPFHPLSLEKTQISWSKTNRCGHTLFFCIFLNKSAQICTASPEQCLNQNFLSLKM